MIQITGLLYMAAFIHVGKENAATRCPEGLNDRSDSTELTEVQAIYCLESAPREAYDGKAAIFRPLSRPLCYSEDSCALLTN
jgi:hypothetical protein